MGSLGNPAGCKPEVLRDMLGAIPRLATNMRINKCNVKVGTCWLVRSLDPASLSFAFCPKAKLSLSWDGVMETKSGAGIKVVLIGPSSSACWCSQITIYKDDRLTRVSRAKFKMLWDLADQDLD